MFRKASVGKHTEIIKGLHLKTVTHGKQTLMTEVRLEKGTIIPPHRHPHEQTGYLVSGQMDFLVDGAYTVADPGDSWNIPANVEHGATAVEASLVVEVFSPVREDYLPYFTPDE